MFHSRFQKIIFALIGVSLSITIWFYLKSDSPQDTNPRYRFVQDRIDFEYHMLKDPTTGQLPENIRNKELDFALAQPVVKRKNGGSIETRGPNNFGGRTRAIAVDLSDPSGNTLFAGGVNGGVFRSTDRGMSWTKVSPAWALHSVTTIAQDPTDHDVWYYGTGEVLGSVSQGSFYVGDGIWKSNDGGNTFYHLDSTKSPDTEQFDFTFDLVHRIRVHPTTGHVYVAAHRAILRSTDGGATWENLLSGPTPTTGRGGFGDVAMSVDGSFIFAAMPGGSEDNLDGIYMSESGEPGTWEKLSGTNAPLSPPTWAPAGSYGRIVLGTDPNNPFRLYALYDNGHQNDCSGTIKPEADLFRLDLDSNTWTDLTPNIPDEGPCTQGNSPLAVQGGYNLTVAVSPLDPNLVVIGGTNLFLSTTGFTTPSEYQRIGGYAHPTSYNKYRGSHPDMHTSVFNPFIPELLLSGNDGGIMEATIINSDASVTWTNLNNGFVTYQYYHVAISPREGDETVIGGTQDNGTSLSEGTPEHSEIYGGDGVAVGIAYRDQLRYFILGSQYGDINRMLGSRATPIKPSSAGQGLFVTYFHLDPDNNDFLYYVDDDRLFRTDSSFSVSVASWVEMTGVASTLGSNIFSIATTRGPYSPSSILYMGTDAGQIFKLTDPQGSDPTTSPIDITPPDLATFGGAVSSLSVDPENDQVLVATVSNYTVPGIYYTEDGGATWEVIEGNLELPSIRSSAIVNYGTYREIFVGTSVGLWSTTSPNGTETRWIREDLDGEIIPVVTSLDLRPSDNHMAIGTHGNGLFYAKLQARTAVASNRTFQYMLPMLNAFEYSDSLIRLVNPSSSETAQVDMFGFGSGGVALGEAVAPFSLPPKSSFDMQLSDAFPSHHDDIAWVQIGSSSELVSIVELQAAETRSAYQASIQEGLLYLPHIAKSTTQFETILAVANGGNSNVTPELSVNPIDAHFGLDAAGTPFGSFQAPITDLLGPDLSQGPDIWGVLNSAQPIHGAMEVFRTLPSRSKEAGLGLSSQSGTNLRFLHVALDTSFYWTGMVYINVSDQTATIEERHFSNSGDLMGTYPIELGAGEKRTLLYDATNQTVVVPGTGWIEIASNQNLIGYELFGSPNTSQDDNFAGLQGNFETSTSLCYPYLVSSAQFFTGLVVVNPSEQTAQVQAHLMDAAGSVLESVTLAPLAAKSKFTTLVGNGNAPLFSNVNSGTWIQIDSDTAIAGFLLWGDHNGPNRRFLSGVNAVPLSSP